MFENEYESILDHYKSQNWREILNLRKENGPLKIDWNKLSWAWPTIDNLLFLKNTLHTLGVENITSIGSGTGLFEWFVQQTSGLPVRGLEVDEKWWRSKYAMVNFIPTDFFENLGESGILRLMGMSTALMFCYFNDQKAFNDYLKIFEGSVIVIVGPGLDSSHHTEPAPLDAGFVGHEWELVDYQNMDGMDVMAIYRKTFYS